MLWITACNEERQKFKQVDTLSRKSNTKSNADTSIRETIKNNIVSPEYYVWLVDFEAKTKKQNAIKSKENYNADSIISSLNNKFKNIPLRKTKQFRDTLFLEITDSHILTQQMGSSGAAQYLAETVINLTSVSGINFIKIDFEEGDHASPGIWSAKDYADVKAIQ